MPRSPRAARTTDPRALPASSALTFPSPASSPRPRATAGPPRPRSAWPAARSSGCAPPRARDSQLPDPHGPARALLRRGPARERRRQDLETEGAQRSGRRRVTTPPAPTRSGPLSPPGVTRRTRVGKRTTSGAGARRRRRMRNGRGVSQAIHAGARSTHWPIQAVRPSPSNALEARQRGLPLGAGLEEYKRAVPPAPASASSASSWALATATRPRRRPRSRGPRAGDELALEAGLPVAASSMVRRPAAGPCNRPLAVRGVARGALEQVGERRRGARRGPRARARRRPAGAAPR